MGSWSFWSVFGKIVLSPTAMQEPNKIKKRECQQLRYDLQHHHIPMEVLFEDLYEKPGTCAASRHRFYRHVSWRRDCGVRQQRHLLARHGAWFRSCAPKLREKSKTPIALCSPPPTFPAAPPSPPLGVCPFLTMLDIPWAEGGAMIGIICRSIS